MAGKKGSGWVLWGFHSEHQTTPIKLTGGGIAHCRDEAERRRETGWVCAVYMAGTAPEGLRAQARMEAATG